MGKGLMTGAGEAWKACCKTVLTGNCSGDKVGKGLTEALAVVVVTVRLVVVGGREVVSTLGVVMITGLLRPTSLLKLTPKLVALSPVPNLVKEKDTLLPGILGMIFLSSSRSMRRESVIPC